MPLSAVQREAQTLRMLAEARLADRLAATADLDDDRRCTEVAENLVLAAAVPTRWSVIQEQLGGGMGSELKPTGGHRPKFCSAFSSCALAVNSFAPFVDEDRTLTIPGPGAFGGGVKFEAQRSAGVRGYKPNLDLVVEPDENDWLFVESKCLEYLRPHTTDFSTAFVDKAGKLFGPPTATFYARFREAKEAGQHLFELVDAAQLLKHFLAAKVAADGRRQVTLAYVFWEPADADDHEAFRAHRHEAQQLAAALIDDEAKLVPLAYHQIWAGWAAQAAADGDAELSAHVRALEARYTVVLGEDLSSR